MDIGQIVSVSITRNTVFPSRAGFGTPMFAAYHNLWSARVRKFTSKAAVLAAVVAGGGTAAHPIYQAASVVFGQERTPKEWVVGKRTRAFTQTVTLEVKNNTEGFVYEFDVTGPNGTTTTITYTVGAAQTLTQVATAIAALIDAISDVAASSVGAVITCTVAAGLLANFKNLPPISVLLVKVTTADPGVDDDLGEILAATKLTKGAISWYGFSLDSCGEAEFLSAAAWVQGEKLVFCGRQSDGTIADPAVTNDAFSDAVAAAYDRVLPLFAQSAVQDYRDAAILALQLPKEPGTTTYAFKTLAGITVDALSDEEESTIRVKRGTTYTRTNAINITYEGQTPEGTFFDTMINIDFVSARFAEDVYGYLQSQEIVPFTQLGIDAVLQVGQTRLDRCTRNPNPIFTTDDGGPVVEPILVSDVDTGDKASRRLTGVSFRGTLAGGIHGVTVLGTVAV